MERPPDCLSVREFAKAQGIGIRTVWYWIARRRILKKHVVRRGGRTWIRREALLYVGAPLGRGRRADAYGLAGR